MRRSSPSPISLRSRLLLLRSDGPLLRLNLLPFSSRNFSRTQWRTLLPRPWSARSEAPMNRPPQSQWNPHQKWRVHPNKHSISLRPPLPLSLTFRRCLQLRCLQISLLIHPCRSFCKYSYCFNSLIICIAVENGTCVARRQRQVFQFTWRRTPSPSSCTSQCPPARPME